MAAFSAARGVLFGFAMAAAFGLSATGARAEYPDRTITLLSSSNAGSGGDIIVRFYAKKLEELTGKNFIVENKPGANGHIGTETLMRAKPDGYTILLNGASFVVGNTFTMKVANYDPVNDLQAVSGLFGLGVALITGTKNDIKSVADLVAFLKKKNGDASYGTSNVSNQISTALLLTATGTKGLAVQYKTPQQQVDDLVAGLVDFGFSNLPQSIAEARNGRVKLLAVTTKDRAPAAPDVPTMIEAGVPNYVYSVIWAAWFPKDTPRDITLKMNEWLTKVNSDPETKKFLMEQGANDLITPTPEEAQAAVKAFYDQWAQITGQLNIQKQ